jgi:hypothetical protein
MVAGSFPSTPSSSASAWSAKRGCSEYALDIFNGVPEGSSDQASAIKESQAAFQWPLLHSVGPPRLASTAHRRPAPLAPLLKKSGLERL